MNTDKHKAGSPAAVEPKPDLDLKRWEGGSAPHEPGSFADKAEPAAASGAERKVQAPHAKPAENTLGQDEKHDQLAKKAEDAEDRQEALLDEGVEETFPASDPVSVKRIT